MNKTIHAVFEHGLFRPLDPVDLPEKVEVEFEPRLVTRTVEWPPGYFDKTAGALAGEIFVRPDQGTLPSRELW